jgi:hypothetical protein
MLVIVVRLDDSRMTRFFNETGGKVRARPEVIGQTGSQTPQVPRLRSLPACSLVKRVVTIGVYEWDLDTFLEALHMVGVCLLLDVRQRRGVGGREYAWANAMRLEHALAPRARIGGCGMMFGCGRSRS